MDEEHTFRLNFISQFIATRAAIEYPDACSNGTHDILEQFHSMEDAIFLAGIAWNRYKELILGEPEGEP